MILQPTEVKSAGQIWDLMMGKKTRSFDDCPWVKVGNLYMSVTFTGDESWYNDRQKHGQDFHDSARS